MSGPEFTLKINSTEAIVSMVEALEALMVDEDGRGRLIGWVPVFWSGEPGSSVTATERFISAAQVKDALRKAGRLP